MRAFAYLSVLALGSLFAANSVAASSVADDCDIGYDCDFCDIYQKCEETFNFPECDPSRLVQLFCDGPGNWVCITYNPNICL